MYNDDVLDVSLDIEWYVLGRILYDAGLLRIVISGNFM
jgi:hypothetical protein